MRDGRRLDVRSSSGHDRFVEEDYRRLRAEGILAAREGIGWPQVERSPGEFDFSRLEAILRASGRHGIQVMWDLCHFGWPDDVDPFAPSFADRLGGLTAAFLEWHLRRGSPPSHVTPVNEISFVAWAGGDVEYLNPFGRGRGNPLKRSLVRGAIAASREILALSPETRIVHIDPIIHVAPNPAYPVRDAEAATASQWEAWDMISGRRDRELGGAPEFLDVVGVNFYPRNEWMDRGDPLSFGDAGYRPLADLLGEVASRYGRPMILTETGTEGDARAGWFREIAAQVQVAQARGIPIEGLCLYPIVDHPGWDDDRHCPNGLWGYPTEEGWRPPHSPLLTVVREVVGPDRDRRGVIEIPDRHHPDQQHEAEPDGCEPEPSG